MAQPVSGLKQPSNPAEMLGVRGASAKFIAQYSSPMKSVFSR
jgi:hypothetical protein